ncbi:hypothetical protein RND71_035158 [Anisodus tanguticus]|uniref:Uncharacterized protein n=1 Tax=Anisodus tanguticus TaxID=243964 RepID=A0AAE1R6M0_9SOLA|nr:hypothetical protein RND71_035158 [Anisodus tanguticus]
MDSETQAPEDCDRLDVQHQMQKRPRNDGKLDDEAEVKLHKFQELHEKEIQEKGADKLSIEEAFTDVLDYRPGYARELGKGAP